MIEGNRKPRIFVIDDETPIGKVIYKGLHHNIDVVLATNLMPRDSKGRILFDPGKALDLLCDSDELFDLTLLDLIMPDINGIEFHKRLLMRAPYRCQRLVFITGGFLIPGVEVWLRESGVQYLEKPFSIEKLEEVIFEYAFKDLPRGP